MLCFYDVSGSGLDPDFSNSLDPDPDSAKCLDPAPNSVNTDPKHWSWSKCLCDVKFVSRVFYKSFSDSSRLLRL
jgi:hypothetical protein